MLWNDSISIGGCTEGTAANTWESQETLEWHQAPTCGQLNQTPCGKSKFLHLETNLSPGFPGRSSMASACVAFRPMCTYLDWARRAPAHSDVELEGIHCLVGWILPFPHHSLSALFTHILLSSSFHTTAQALEYYILHSQNCFQFWLSLQ